MSMPAWPISALRAMSRHGYRPWRASMARILNPGRPPAGGYPLDAGRYDEAFAASGPRSAYVEVLDALAGHDLVELRERVRSNAAALDLSFGQGRELVLDPVPRVLDSAEWERLEAGLLQRARALNAFLADAYGGQRIFDADVIPRRLLETSAGFEPKMRGLLDPGLPAATVAGPGPNPDPDRRSAGPGGQLGVPPRSHHPP